MGKDHNKWPVDSPEFSDADDERAKAKKANNAPDNRRVLPPLPRSEGMFGFNQRREFSEAPLRPPIPLEKIANPEKVDEVEDDEDDEDDANQIDELPTTISEAKDATELTVDDSPEEVFETELPQPATASSEPSKSEFMDIPLVEEAAPSTPTFEDIMEREMPAEFVEATSGPELGSPAMPNTWDAAATKTPLESSFFDKPREPDEPARPSGFGGSSPAWRPATPDRSFASSSPAEYASPSPDTGGGGWSPSPESGGGVSSGFTTALEALKAITDLAELANNPYPLATRVLTELAVEGYLSERKRQRYEKIERQLDKRDEEMSGFHAEQRQANERLSAQLAAAGQLQAEAVEQIFDQEGNRIALRPGEHMERSAGGFSVVLDKHNRVVHDAIRYGEAFQREAQREQVKDDLFSPPRAAGGPMDVVSMGSLPSMGGQQDTAAYGGQGSTNSQTGPTDDDLQHRLPEPRNQIKAAALSPWLWTAIAFLIIIYFIASLA